MPALLVSPYARRGFVDSTPLDTTSIPAFVERNWGLARRTRARTFERAFDFARAPREPSIPAAERRPAARRGVRLWVIYVGYGAALVLSGILIGWVGLRRTLVVTALLAVSAAPAAAQAPDTIQTVPAVPGMRFSLSGVEFRADAAGRAHPPATPDGSLTALTTDVKRGVRARFDRWYAGRRIAALNLEYRVGFRFVDLNGNRVDPRVVSSLTLAGSNGRRQVFSGSKPRWLQGNRVIPESGGTKSTAVSYSAQEGTRRRARRSSTRGSNASSPPRPATCSSGSCCSRLASRSAMLCSASRSAQPFCSSIRTAGFCGRPSAPVGS